MATVNYYMIVGLDFLSTIKALFPNHEGT
jgi:hypothetical protein